MTHETKRQMRAALVNDYGPPDGVHIGELPDPVPAAGQVRVRVRAASVNRTDCGELRGHPFFIRVFYGLRRPRRSVFGFDFAGTVDAVGAEVAAFRAGDRVFGICPSRSNGSHAEYVAVPQRLVAHLPEGLPFAEGVACEGAYYALSTLRRIGLRPGQSILVYGASGAIGTAMVQLAKLLEARVTAVVATPQRALLASIGADRVVDYTAGDFTASDERYDHVIDAVGKARYFDCRHLIKPGGIFASTDLGPWGQNVALMLLSSITHRHRVVVATPGPINDLFELMRQGWLGGRFRAVVDRRYPLVDIVEAYRFVETGRKVGVVVVEMPG
jgi:NADPH:quinone reductase-like Zn-dependent oxidoreductase